MTPKVPSGAFDVRPIGVVESTLRDLENAPPQGDEGAPDAWLVLEPGVADGLQGLAVGDRLVVVTWLDQADRSVLLTHPRGDVARPEQGVFLTRSPHRPNPIGLHEVTVRAIEGVRIRVEPLEALDGTPIVDLKAALPPVGDR